MDAAFVADTSLATLSPARFSYQREGRGYSVERVGEGMRRSFVAGLRPSPEAPVNRALNRSSAATAGPVLR